METPLRIPIPLAEEADRAQRKPAAGRAGAEQRGPGRAGGKAELARAPRVWDLPSLAGALAEISSPVPGGALTAAARLVRSAQEQGEPAAWIAAGDSLFHAPDLHDSGVDLAALPVVRVAGPIAGARAAEHLLRSGAFGLVVLDFGRGGSSAALLPAAAQVRLAALCRRHQAALLLLARKPEGAAPAASLSSLRARGAIHRAAFDRFNFRLHVLKDKRQGTGWSHEETCRGPDGLC